MRPRCSILTGGFDFSGCGDCTSCPPIEPAEMSNSEPSAIVLHGIPCIGGLYISFDFEWRKRFAQGSPRFTLSRSRMRSRTGLASPVENQGSRDRKGSQLACSSARGADDSCKRHSVYQGGSVVPEPTLLSNVSNAFRAGAPCFALPLTQPCCALS